MRSRKREATTEVQAARARGLAGGNSGFGLSALGFQLCAFTLCFQLWASLGALPLIVLLYNTISSGDVVGVS